MALDDVYRTEARFLQHLQLQAANIDQYKTELNASAAQIQAIKDNADNFEWLIETCNTAGEFKLTGFAIKGQFFSNKTSPPVGDFSAPPATTPPHTPIMAGAVKYHRDLDQLFLRQPGLSEACRTAMDLVGPQEEEPDAATMKADIECKTAMQGNFDFSLVVDNRGKSDQNFVRAAPVGTTDWQQLDPFVGKATTCHYPGTGDQPIQLMVVVQMKRKNENYGVPSDPFIMTVIP